MTISTVFEHTAFWLLCFFSKKKKKITLGSGELNADLKIIIPSLVRSICVNFPCYLSIILLIKSLIKITLAAEPVWQGRNWASLMQTVPIIWISWVHCDNAVPWRANIRSVRACNMILLFPASFSHMQWLLDTRTCFLLFLNNIEAVPGVFTFSLCTS